MFENIEIFVMINYIITSLLSARTYWNTKKNNNKNNKRPEYIEYMLRWNLLKFINQCDMSSPFQAKYKRSKTECLANSWLPNTTYWTCIRWGHTLINYKKSLLRYIGLVTPIGRDDKERERKREVKTPPNQFGIDCSLTNRDWSEYKIINPAVIEEWRAGYSLCFLSLSPSFLFFSFYATCAYAHTSEIFWRNTKTMEWKKIVWHCSVPFLIINIIIGYVWLWFLWFRDSLHSVGASIVHCICIMHTDGYSLMH